MMVSPKAESGRLDSPIREEIDELPSLMKVGFLLDVVLNSKKEIVAVVAGDPIKAHRKGVEFVDRMYSIRIPQARHRDRERRRIPEGHQHVPGAEGYG
jgi:nickel-dependent lactate racemase